MAASEITGKVQQWEETGIAVADGTNTTIQTIIVPNAARFCTVTVKNSHETTAFDAFNVAFRPTTNAPFVTHASIADSFTTPVHPLLSTSGSPVTLAAAASVRMEFLVSSIDAIRLQASGAGAAGTAEVYFNFGA